MSRVFSIPTALRVLPNDLLRRFFAKLDHADLDVNWDALGKHDPKPIMKAILGLEQAQFDRIEAALHTLFNLACDTGIAAIRESGELTDGPPPLAEIPEGATTYHQAVAAWIANPDAITRAVRIHQVENLTWWRKRKDLPRRAPDLSEERLEQFRKDLSDLLLTAEGRGRHCSVEQMTRKGIEYVFAHPDDFAQSATVHDRGVLVPRTFRHTFPIVFAFDPAEGTLETFAKVPSKTKPKVEALFARALLGVPKLPDWPKRPAYQLNHLKPRSFTFESDPADNFSVEVRLMRFKYVSNQRQMTFEGDPQWTRDTHNLIDAALNQDRVPLSSLNLTLVRLDFTFSDGREPNELSLDISSSGSCNLRNLPPHRADMIQKYLRRWGIDADGSLAAAG